MLQSEFFERTHITLTGEEYADVECLYNAVKMDKDKFCKCWVSEKKNPLFKELAEAFCHEYRMHIADINQMQANSKLYMEEIESIKKAKNEMENEMINRFNAQINGLAARIISLNIDDKKLYDLIEEEFSIGFIIKTKRDAGIPLTEEEIDYMVGRL